MTRTSIEQRLLDSLDTLCDPGLGQGLADTAGHLLRSACDVIDARSAALVPARSLSAQAWVNTSGGGFSALPSQTRDHLDPLLAGLPASGVAHGRGRAFGWLGGTRLLAGGHGPLTRVQGPLTVQIERLCQMLDVRSLAVVPLMRAGRCAGHLVVGLDRVAMRRDEQAALAGVAPEMHRLVETAALVDRLQQECARLARSRLGRDLHDSAIQPYLGLKYAVEGLARRAGPDNTLHADLAELACQVGHEVTALRELIRAMRQGEPAGSDRIETTVEAQARHFARLFDIDVQVDCPERLQIDQPLRGALFHMVNEVLNNVRKHTPARHVGLTLTAAASAISLQVRDDAGSILGHPVPDFQPASLGERVAELGGQLALHRPDGLNTEMVITLPV